MSLEYPAEWKFEGVGESIPRAALDEFRELVSKIATGSERRKSVFETFKIEFGQSGTSTSTSWAESDLSMAMASYCENAVEFIDSLWSGIEAVQELVPVPSSEFVNKILAKHSIPLRIDPPELKLVRGDITTVASAGETFSTESVQPTYLVGELIGRGGFGMVYKVSRTTSITDFVYAMKVLEPNPFNENKERAAARFRREIDALKSLDHRGIIKIIEAGIDQNDKPYILMPLIDGTNIRTALEGANLETVCEAFEEVLRALEYAHSKNVLHRDLRPANILVRGSDSQPIILDFGNAYFLDAEDEESLTTKYFGTLGYIPPEVQADPKLHSRLHDIYSCGVILYECVARSHPNWHDYEPLSRISNQFAALDAVVKSAIHPVPMQRMQEATEFIWRLEEILEF